MALIQANRQAKFLIDDKDEDFLILQRMEGGEGISELFEFELVVLGDKNVRTDIDLNELLGRHAQVELEAAEGAKRWFCGNITSMSFIGFRDDDLAIFQVRLRPWFWFLTRTRNSRVFQNLKVPEIIEEVFKGHGLSDYLIELDLEEYQLRDYCVQYRESDFDFVSRLMEEEGIHYFFRHESGKHVLILANDSTIHEPLSEAHQGVSNDMDSIVWDPDPDGGPGQHMHDWRMRREIRVESVELRDYNYIQPNLMEAKSKVQESETFAGPGSVSLEFYDYPARFPQHRSKEVSPDLTRSAMIWKEEMQAAFEVLAGQARIRTLVPGYQFKLANHDRADQIDEYLVTTTRHELSLPDFDRSGSWSDEEADYKVTLSAVPSGISYQPERKTPQPIVHGPQTAVVVGPEGQEIDVDDHGRVKVQFHWDREGKRDENSSCRVRVSQAWAGKGWGAFYFPRIGHEVIVEFLEGNPDRPIITGAVYNGENRPPFDAATQSGVKTHSTPNGGTSDFNEIRFEDKKGEEKLSIHAEKDMDISVENDRSELVEGNESVVIKKDRTHAIEGNDSRTVDKNDREIIKGDQTIDVEGDRVFKVTGKEHRDIDGDQIEEVCGKWKKDVDGKIKIESKKDIDLKSGGQISLVVPHHTHFGEFAINLQGSTIGVAGNTSDFKATALSVVVGLNLDFKGINMGVTGMDASKTLFELKMSHIRKINEKVALKKRVTSLANQAIDLALKQVTIDLSDLEIHF
jgi:type VI secretion system secreted protein VgrG